jgi:transcription-repair coupling factor (superfamily II helicase)
LVYLARDESHAREVADDVAFFAGTTGHGEDAIGPGADILLVPEIDTSPYADASADPRSVATRLAAASRIHAGKPKLVVLSLRSLRRRVMPVSAFEAHSHSWRLGEEVDREEAIASLVASGYQRVEIVEDPGSFAVRGAVMDVFVPLGRFPARLEWFGDEIERIRLFDPESQRSLREVDELLVHPVRETIHTARGDLRSALLALSDRVEAPSSVTRQVLDNLQAGIEFFGIEGLTPIFHDAMVPLWDHFPVDARWYVDDPEAMVGLAKRLESELESEYETALKNRRLVASPAEFGLSALELTEFIRGVPVVGDRLELHDPGREDDRAPLRIDLRSNLELETRLKAARANKAEHLLRPLVDHLRALGGSAVPARAEVEGEDRPEQDPWQVMMVAPNLSQAERLTALLRGHGLDVKDPRETGRGAPVDPAGGAGEAGTSIQVLAGRLSQGFCSPADRLLILGESDVFGAKSHRRIARRKRVGVASLSQLAVGDYIVHLLHGIGRYQGLTKLRLQGRFPADFVLIEYAGKDKLYLPVHRIGEIERYLSAEAKPPKLDKMGGTTFAAKARKVQADVRQLAEELLQIYAQREAMVGHAHVEIGDDYAEFEGTFPFEETPDQAIAIDAVQEDLSAPQPMDRLVCGDVGFGKTEVALRAAFRVAMGGHQVAVLAPTTVLVQQHYLTFADRLSSFPVEVACLNRFQSPRERKLVVERIRSGQVDVVVGTHRLLSKDVRFSRLGLVVIDEEQRFGVAQKERFKKLKTKVDVLALTATPIPRTLHMSLLGMREVSMITTPPVDRLAIRTFITRQGDQVIEEGVRKELARGGQVFYVVPRILGIEEHARRIRELVPDARVLVAHGGMPAEMLERAMVDFVEHRADVLVATTIVESGLDIPRANTMFISRADHFGLAQLYQLRGRIGRSKQRATCYLMVNSLERLSAESRRRLEALQRNSALGSGFNVASEDLEIRGAGDLLGRRQSGNIQALGFEAYARILGEAVAELRGEPIHRESDPELSFDVPAYLPDTHVEDTGQRLDLYRRLSCARDAQAVREVMEELADRFGDPPIEALNFGAMMVCKTYGRRLAASSLELARGRLSIRLKPETPIDVEQLMSWIAASGGRLRFTDKDRLVVQLEGGAEASARKQLDECESLLAELMTRTS